MPLSDHEQRILAEIERRLQQDDPRLAERVSKTTVFGHAVRRVRWGAVGFVVGFVGLMMFALSVWVAIAGFGIMLASALFVYHHLKRAGRDQIREVESRGRFSPTSFFGRIAGRFRPGRPDDH